MKIGLLSDTHSFLDPKVFDYFKDCDEIWHGGDFGIGVLEPLEQFKPVRAVFENIDDQRLRHKLPEDLWFSCEGLTIFMTHIGGAPPNYNPRTKKILKQRVPDIFICGHSHILRIKKDPNYNNMLYLNPGAAPGVSPASAEASPEPPGVSPASAEASPEPPGVSPAGVEA